MKTSSDEDIKSKQRIPQKMMIPITSGEYTHPHQENEAESLILVTDAMQILLSDVMKLISDLKTVIDTPPKVNMPSCIRITSVHVKKGWQYSHNHSYVLDIA